MDLIAAPLRFAGAFPPSPPSLATQLIRNLALDGVVLIAARHFRRRRRFA